MMPSQWDVCQLWIKLVNLLQTSGGAKSRSDSGWRTRSRDRKSGSSGISSSCSSWKCFTTRIPAALKNGSMAPQQVQSPQHGSTARTHVKKTLSSSLVWPWRACRDRVQRGKTSPRF